MDSRGSPANQSGSCKGEPSDPAPSSSRGIQPGKKRNRVGATRGTGRDGGDVPTREDRQFAMYPSPGPPSRATSWLGRPSARIFVNEPLRKASDGAQTQRS